MNKQLWAMLVKMNILSFMLVFSMGVATDYFTNEPYSRSPLLAGALSYGLYVFALALISLITLMTHFLYLRLFSDKDLIETMVADFHRLKIPPPRNQDPKNFSYFALLANDESEQASDRVKAAMIHGDYQNAISQGLFKGIRIKRAIDNAVLRFHQEAPERDPNC